MASDRDLLRISARRPLGIGLALIVFLTAFPALATPKITSAFPEWIQRGTTYVVQFEGEDLTNVTGFLFSGDDGLTATNAPPLTYNARIEGRKGGIVPAEGDDKTLRVSVTAAPDAELGPREFRLITPAGVSGPVTLNVGFLREIVESGGNHSTTNAQEVELPVGINGSITESAETDFFRFQAHKGQQLIFEVIAFRAGSPLDSSLALFDASGNELARGEDANGLDSLIPFTVAEDGEYYLQIRDFRYEGGKAFKYRIVAGELPYLDSVFPLGGPRGKVVEVALRGRNLERLEKMKLKIEPTAPLGRQEIRARTEKGYSNPVLFDVGETPEFNEAEPNNTTNKANAVTLPVTINGRISGEKDADCFKFKAEKDQRLIIEVAASRFGSPLDAVITLTDMAGKVIQENDDASGADARIEEKFPEAGEYVVRIRDLLNRGGGDFGYRLAIRPPQPDFALSFSPDVPRLNRGSQTVIAVEVQRSGGFNGPVETWLEDLPPGVTAQRLLIPPDNAVSPRIVLHANDDAPLGVHKLRAMAGAVIQGQRVLREAKPQFDGRAVREAFLSVLDRPPFTLEPITLSARTEQGQSATTEVALRRQGGFMDEIQVTADGFSAGKEPLSKNVDLETVTNRAPGSRVTLKLKAKPDAETGTRMIVFKGEAKVDGQTVTQFSQPIPFTIDPLPFALSSSLPRLAVTALPPEKKSAASEAEFTIKASRRGWFTDDINLTVEGLPEGVTITSTNLSRGIGEASYKIVATDKAPVGKEISFTVIGTAEINGRRYQSRAPAIKLTVNAPEDEARVAASKETEK